jgi:Tfp pilus assembly protein PilN
MRPVNLIPPEERSGARKPMRGGPLAYVVVGALALALVGVTLLVTTSNTIIDRKAEATTLEGEISAAKSRAESLKAYTEFHQVREQRLATITSLADSRFDWERVMRELSLILPSDVWLTGLSASAGAGASTGGEGGFGVSGPSLNLTGCATSQAAVAGFIEALKEIDGVTRVGMQGSSLGGGGVEGASTGSATAGAGCSSTDQPIAQFQMTVAFDAAPVPTESTPEAPAPSAPPASEGENETEGGEGATTSEPASATTSETTGEG